MKCLVLLSLGFSASTGSYRWTLPRHRGRSFTLVELLHLCFSDLQSSTVAPRLSAPNAELAHAARAERCCCYLFTLGSSRRGTGGRRRPNSEEFPPVLGSDTRSHVAAISASPRAPSALRRRVLLRGGVNGGRVCACVFTVVVFVDGADGGSGGPRRRLIGGRLRREPKYLSSVAQ